MLAIVREHLANPAVDHRLGFRLDRNKDMPAILLWGPTTQGETQSLPPHGSSFVVNSIFPAITPGLKEEFKSEPIAL